MQSRDEPLPDPLGDILRPPPHESRRCGAHCRTTGMPCRTWAVRGSMRCRLHGGAKRSGRPPTTGLFTAQAKRERRFQSAVRYLLRHRCTMPDPVEPPELYASADGSYASPMTQSGSRIAALLSPMPADARETQARPPADAGQERQRGASRPARLTDTGLERPADDAGALPASAGPQAPEPLGRSTQ